MGNDNKDQSTKSTDPTTTTTSTPPRDTIKPTKDNDSTRK